jgi:hypothetical protein
VQDGFQSSTHDKVQCGLLVRAQHRNLSNSSLQVACHFTRRKHGLVFRAQVEDECLASVRAAGSICRRCGHVDGPAQTCAPRHYNPLLVHRSASCCVMTLHAWGTHASSWTQVYAWWVLHAPHAHIFLGTKVL